MSNTRYSAFVGFILIILSSLSYAQKHDSEPVKSKIYHETPAKVNDLVHTKLDVMFDYKKRYLYGKEWVTLKPHFYPTDSLRLDAKGMNINNISIVKNSKYFPLKFKYDESLTLAIQLDKVYNRNEKYTIYIDYTAKPDEINTQGSTSVIKPKGLFFINPDGSEKDKPTQIWTQGETENSSAWFPTIDKPSQKTTSEISMTVPAKYVTLSNGRLASQKSNANGTRTDIWKMELPHSPYLFMMAVGDFKIYKDKWRDKEVSYYLEPKYAPYAKQIFGETPEMMEFFSRKLGVNFPWNKYAQIVVRDFPGGAMENTSATLYGVFIQQTSRELLDANYDYARETIVHELFHQWFSAYVTAESWSNLTVNESFANFSEALWAEHKYGKDEGDATGYKTMQSYLKSPDDSTKNLVRFSYSDKEDMFDLVSYNKGGSIVNMLRNYLGEEAFFNGLNIYLKTNAFKTGEAHQVRLAMEEASGLDLNWFFNQWYFGAGHPVLDINYKWDESSKTQIVYLKQTQQGQIFRLPMAIDIYTGDKKQRHQIWMTDKNTTLTFSVKSKPDLVNVDADKVLLAVKTDHKTSEELVFQYFHAPLYLDCLEAIDTAANHQSENGAQKVMIAALKDPYYGLRIKTIKALDLANNDVRNTALPILKLLVGTDKNTLVRAAAIIALGTEKTPENLALFKNALTSQSYAVQAAALNAIGFLDAKESLIQAKAFEKDNKGALTKAIIAVYAKNGNSAKWPYVFDTFNNQRPNDRYRMLGDLASMIGRIDNSGYALEGIAAIANTGVEFKSAGVAPGIIKLLEQIKIQRLLLHDELGVKAADDAILKIIDAR